MTLTASTPTTSLCNGEEITIANFDFARAHREGWTISDYGRFKDDSPHVELQKLDKLINDVRIFHEDKEAWAFVVAQARTGSLFHIQALSLVDRRERKGIETLFGCW